jgi:DNA-binding MltR family transcriptional regulator
MSAKKWKLAVPLEQLSEDTRHLVDVLNSEGDLACVVVGAAFLDAALKTLLSEKLLKSSDTTVKLLDDGGPLGTFSARADLAYCLSLVSKHRHKDLRLVMEIRNQFAHRHLKLAFDDSTVREMCGRLNEWKMLLHGQEEDTTSELTPKELNTKARNQFNLSVIFLSNWLLLTALGLKGGAPAVGPTEVPDSPKHHPAA